MSDKEKSVYNKIGNVLGFDILNDFKRHGMIEFGDYTYNIADKRRILKIYTELAAKYNIKFFNADNFVDGGKYGCGCECCGTEFLRNHKIWGGCNRAQYYDDKTESSTEFGKCLVNFTRSKGNADRTIADVTKSFVEKDAVPYPESFTLF